VDLLAVFTVHYDEFMTDYGWIEKSEQWDRRRKSNDTDTVSANVHAVTCKRSTCSYMQT